MHDATDARIGKVVADLLALTRLLAPEDLHDLLGSISVEMETAMELVLETQHRPRPGGTVVSFPGPTIRHRPSNPPKEPMT
jgi:hypothetical protein